MTSGNLRILFFLSLFCLACYANARYLQTCREIALAMNIVDQVYVEPTDHRQMLGAAMNGMLKSLDPNSGYIPPEQLQSFQTFFEQEFGGLGVSLEGPPARPHWTIVTTIFDSPAFRAGLRPGDAITQVDGVEIVWLPFEEVSLRLKGREGTAVRLGLEREGTFWEETIVRDRVEIESVIGDRRRSDGRWQYLLEADPRIAYLRVELFGEKTYREFRNALASCEPQPQGLIIDLRDNSGGLLSAAAEICDLFLENGPIVSTRGRDVSEEEHILAAPGVALPDTCSIAILVNENSASASEVVAACLKDRDRALIVGQRSYGKGSVQNVIPLDGGRSAMRLTTAYYYPPSGRRIHRRDMNSQSDEWGVDPSDGCEVSLSREQLEKTVARFRSRSEPAKTDRPDLAAGDTSLEVDAQLWLAVQKLQAKLAAH